MTGDPQLAVERTIAEQLQGITLAAGYDLPQPIQLVSRLILMWDQTGGKYPALIIQTEEAERRWKTGRLIEARLPVRIIGYVRVAEPVIPAQDVGRYRLALQRKLLSDLHLGGLVDLIHPEETPIAALWADQGAKTVYLFADRYAYQYEYDPQEAPVL